MAARMLPFEAATPVSRPVSGRGTVDLAAVSKAILLAMKNKGFAGRGQDTRERAYDAVELSKHFTTLETLLRIHFGKVHSRNLKLMEETGAGVRETTPETPYEGEASAAVVAGYKALVNANLWDLLFMIIYDTAMDLVVE